MGNSKYVLSIRILSLVLASIAFLTALSAMIFYVIYGGASLFSIVFLPLLIVSMFFTAITTMMSLLNMGSVLGKIALLLDAFAIAFIIVSFIYLFKF